MHVLQGPYEYLIKPGKLDQTPQGNRLGSLPFPAPHRHSLQLSSTQQESQLTPAAVSQFCLNSPQVKQSRSIYVKWALVVGRRQQGRRGVSSPRASIQSYGKRTSIEKLVPVSLSTRCLFPSVSFGCLESSICSLDLPPSTTGMGPSSLHEPSSPGSSGAPMQHEPGAKRGFPGTSKFFLMGRHTDTVPKVKTPALSLRGCPQGLVPQSSSMPALSPWPVRKVTSNGHWATSIRSPQ